MADQQRRRAGGTAANDTTRLKTNVDDDGEDDEEVKCCCCSRNRFYETLFFAFVFLLLLGGIAASAAGWYLRIEYWHFLQVFYKSVFTLCVYFLIIGGAFNILLGILGITFAKSKKRCHKALLMVLIGLIVSLILQVAVGIAACVYSTSVDLRIAHDLDSVILAYYDSSRTEASKTRFTEAVDTLQRSFRCCGASNYTMWLAPSSANSTQIPDSCCISQQVGQVAGCAQLVHPSNIYFDGCYELLAHYIRGHLWLVGVLVLGTLIYQVFGVWLTFEEYRIKKPSLHLHVR